MRVAELAQYLYLLMARVPHVSSAQKLAFTEGALSRIAVACAALALLIAPFRGSAGWRASLLVVAAALIIAGTRARGSWRNLLPPFRPLQWALAAWVGYALIWASLSANPLASLDWMRGNVITPILAFGVFYTLTVNVSRLNLFITVLVVGLVPLAVMVALDPFQPSNMVHAPLYGSVGLLSAWLVAIAPLLAITFWMVRGSRTWQGRCFAFCFVLSFVACLLCAAWFTGNRIVWLCYATMLFVGGAMALFYGGAERKRTAAIALAAAVVGVMLFAASAQFRATVHKAKNGDAVQFLLQDSRAEIWHLAATMIAERPVSGHGVGDQFGDKFSARFTDPVHRLAFRHAHNTVLNYTLMLGVVGGVVIVGLFAALGGAFWSLRNRVGLAKLAAICGLALVAGFFLRNMADDFFSRHTLLVFMAICGMLLGTGVHVPEDEAPPRLHGA